jgi:hypothetical protein
LINRAEIERSLWGAWRLFLDKPDALSGFDFGITGFWRSFQAILLVAPVYFFTTLADRNSTFAPAIAGGRFSAETYWIVQAATLVVDWFTFPALLALIAGFIGIRPQYAAYINVRNWASVLMMLPFLAVAALQAGGVSDDITVLVSLAALFFVLRLGYITARRTLGVAVDVAVALVALDVLVSFGLVTIIGRLTGVEAVDQ